MCSSLVENGNLVRITPDPIGLSEVTDFVIDPSAGGVSIFMGKCVEGDDDL
jgi:molybdopterin synthase catalytic subunit